MQNRYFRHEAADFWPFSEGWFLPAEMIELVNHGYENIVCTQPFGCLPTHVCGKGMIHRIKELYPQANIVPIDYDPGASEVNQLNRIKLMLSTAQKNLNLQSNSKTMKVMQQAETGKVGAHSYQ